MTTTGTDGSPDTTALELRLVALWQDVLDLPDVGPDGEFFALGGNSTLAVELIFRIASELGHRLPVKALVECGTPALMAERISDQGPRP